MFHQHIGLGPGRLLYPMLIPSPADLPDVLCRSDLVLDTVLPVAAGGELLPHHHRDTVVHTACNKLQLFLRFVFLMINYFCWSTTTCAETVMGEEKKI